MRKSKYGMYDILILVWLVKSMAFYDYRILSIGLDVVLFAYTCIILLNHRKVRKEAYRFVLYKLPFVIFACLSLLWCLYSSPVESYVYSLILKLMNSFSIICYISSEERLHKSFRFMVYAAAVLSLRTLLTVPISAYGTARIGIYLSSQSGADFGGSTAMTLVFGFASIFLIFYGKAIKNKKIKIILFIMFNLISLLSGSKKAVFYLIIYLICICYRKSKKFLYFLGKLLIGMVFFLIVYSFMMKNQVFYNAIGSRINGMLDVIFYRGTTDLSTLGRLAYLEDAWKTFLRHPFIGVGLDNFKYYNTHNMAWAENNFLEILADFGLIGFILYHLPHVYILRKLIRNKEKSKVYSLVLVMSLVLLFNDLTIVSYRSGLLQLFFTVLYSTVCIFYTKRLTQRD